MSVTARTLCTRAFDTMGIFAPGEAIPAADMQDAFRRLNAMVSAWGQQPLTIPALSIEDFDLVANKGGLDDPYLIGSGATGDNFDTEKPSNQNSITGAGLLQGGTSPTVEIPYAILTDDAYASIRIKGLGSVYFTGLWYNPTYADGFGRIYLWPVPNTSGNQIRLYILKSLAQFADLSTSYTFPDGYEEALEYNLCFRLGPPYVRPIAPEVRELAVKSLATIKRANTNLVDMPQDPASFGGSQKAAYNILTGMPNT